MLKMICKICKKDIFLLARHVRIHNITGLEYYDIYENINFIVNSYIGGMSALDISKEIKKQNIGFSPSKKQILDYLESKHIPRRNASEARKLNIQKDGGVWNKGLTKYQHPSIMKYSLSRMGENNPIFKLTKEERIKNLYINNCTEEERKNLCGQIFKTLKEKYASGEIIHCSASDPENYKINHDKMMIGYKNWLITGNRKDFTESVNENKIGSFLIEKDIKFIKHYTFKSMFEYDYYLPDFSMVIDYFGKYWHCDPRCYNEEFVHTRRRKTAKEIWNYEKRRIAYAKENCEYFVVIWETDVLKLTESQFKGLVYECIENKISSDGKKR
jgi:hypothetical protein